MNFPIISAVTAAILALFQILLMVIVVLTRAKYKVGIGDGGHADLARRIRIHANLTENAPIFAILLTLLEISGINSTILIGLAALFIMGRLAHAYIVSQTSEAHPLRIFGGASAALTIVIAASLLLWQASKNLSLMG